MRHRPYHRSHRPRGRLLFALFAIVAFALTTLIGTGVALAASTSTPDSSHPYCAGWIKSQEANMNQWEPAADFYDENYISNVSGPLADEQCFSTGNALSAYEYNSGNAGVGNQLGVFWTDANNQGYMLDLWDYFPTQCWHHDTSGDGLTKTDNSIYGTDTLLGTGFNNDISSFWLSPSANYSGDCNKFDVQDARVSWGQTAGDTVSTFPDYYGPAQGVSCANRSLYPRTCIPPATNRSWRISSGVPTAPDNLAGTGWNDAISIFQFYNDEAIYDPPLS